MADAAPAPAPAPTGQVYFEDGTPVPPDQVAAALRSGQAFVDDSAPLQMLTDAGTAVTVAPEELDSALAQGYTFESSEETARRRRKQERGTLGQQALTFAEGVGRGATVGLSDAALVGVLGDEYRQGALERKQENPYVAGTGEVAGLVGGALATGGVTGAVSAPARGMAAAGRVAEHAVGAGLRRLGYQGASRLGRVGARALALGAGGAAEGAMYGAGQAISRTALDGTPLTAEKVLALMGHEALLGTGGAVLVGGGIRAAQAASGAIARRGGRSLSPSLRQTARQLADESALKAIGARGSDLRRLGKTGPKAQQEISEIGEELLSYTFKTGERQGEKLFQFASKADDFVDDLALARRETGEALGRVKQEIDKAAQQNPELAPDLGRYLERVRGEVLDPLQKSMVPAVRARAAKVEEALSDLTARIEAPTPVVRMPDGSAVARERVPLTFDEVDRFRQELRSVFQPPKPTGGGLPAPVPDHAQYLERAERMLAEELDAAAERSLEKMGRNPAEFSSLKRQYRNIRQASDIAEKAALQDLGNRAISPSDYATGLAAGLGALMSGNVGALAAGAASTVAHKLVRERGRSVLAIMADRIAKSDGALAGHAKRLAHGAEKAGHHAHPGVVFEAADRSAQETAKWQYAMAEEAKKVAIQRAPTTAIVRALDDVADEGAGHTTQGILLPLIEAVKEYKTNPQAQQERLARPVVAYVNEYPTLATAVQQQLARTYDYLAENAPRPVGRSAFSLTPDLEPERYSPAELERFARKARGALAPELVIGDLAEGSIDRDGLEALKVIHPETFAGLRKMVIEEVSTRSEPLPFQRRILLSLAFDFTGDPSLDPAFGSALQAVHAGQGAEAPPEQASPTGPSLPDSLASQSAAPTEAM
jgi:hypothetical protein